MTSGAAVWLAVILAVVGLVAQRRMRRRTGGRREQKSQRIGSIGPGVAGAFYEFLNEEKRKAVEIVVEERAGYTDPETRDGDLPQFEIRGIDTQKRPRY